MEFDPSNPKHQGVPAYSSRHAKDPALVAVGEAIRTARKIQGMAQEQLALLAELDRSYLGGVERGESNATVLNIIKISKALGIRSSELLAKAHL